MRVLETTVKELNVECERAQKPRVPSETDVIAKAPNIVINNMDFNFATQKAATKRIKQAVAEPTMARLEQLQA